MDEYNYIERRNQIRRTYKRPQQMKESFFVLKLNMALAIGILVVCANMIDLDFTNALTDSVEKAVTQSMDMTQVKETAISTINFLSEGEGIAAFSKNNYPITIEDSLIKQMHEQATAYENTQKKTLN